MAKVILKTEITGRFNSSRIIMGQTVSFDGEGFTEVEQELAEQLLGGEETYGLQLHEGEITVKKVGKGVDSEELSELTTKLEVAENTIKELEKEIVALKEASEIRNLLKGKTKEELQELCKESEYPVAEWSEIKKIGDLREYMVSQETKQE